MCLFKSSHKFYLHISIKHSILFISIIIILLYSFIINLEKFTIYKIIFLSCLYIILVNMFLSFLEENKSYSKIKAYNISKIFYLIINIIAIFNIFSFSPQNTYLSINNDNIILLTSSLLPYLFLYLAISFANGHILAIIFNKFKTHISDIMIFSMIFIAIKNSILTYAYWFAGIVGMKASLIILYSLLSIIILLFKNNKLTVLINKEEEKLIIISTATLVMYLFTSIFSLLGDQAIMPGSLNSILYRNNLKSFYEKYSFYGLLGAFQIISFIMSTKLENAFLASSLAFIPGYFLLSISLYKLFYLFLPSNKKSKSIFFVCVSIFMDGLGILGLPFIVNDITNGTQISLLLSPRTFSLYFNSAIIQLWYNSYKVFSRSFLVASMYFLTKSYFGEKNKNLFLSSLLLSLTFIYSKDLFYYILFSILLIGINVFNIYDYILILLYEIIILNRFFVMNLLHIVNVIINSTKIFGKKIIISSHEKIPYIVDFSTIFLVILSIIFLYHIIINKKVSQKKKINIYFYNWRKLNIIFYTFIFSMFFSYLAIIFELFNITSQAIYKNIFINSLAYILYRFHIFGVFYYLLPIMYKNNKSFTRSYILFIIIFHLLYNFSGKLFSTILIPEVFIPFSIPLILSLTKHRLERILVMLFTVTGILTGGIYAATITSTDIDPYVLDASHISNILVKNFEANMTICCPHRPAILRYYTYRIAQISNMYFSLDSNNICNIFIVSSKDNNINNYKVLYKGKMLSLISRDTNHDH